MEPFQSYIRDSKLHNQMTIEAYATKTLVGLIKDYYYHELLRNRILCIAETYNIWMSANYNQYWKHILTKNVSSYKLDDFDFSAIAKHHGIVQVTK